MTDMEKIARAFVSLRNGEPYHGDLPNKELRLTEGYVRAITAAGLAIFDREKLIAALIAADEPKAPGRLSDADRARLRAFYDKLLSAGALRPEESSNGN